MANISRKDLPTLIAVLVLILTPQVFILILDTAVGPVGWVNHKMNWQIVSCNYVGDNSTADSYVAYFVVFLTDAGIPGSTPTIKPNNVSPLTPGWQGNCTVDPSTTMDSSAVVWPEDWLSTWKIQYWVCAIGVLVLAIGITMISITGLVCMSSSKLSDKLGADIVQFYHDKWRQSINSQEDPFNRTFSFAVSEYKVLPQSTYRQTSSIQGISLIADHTALSTTRHFYENHLEIELRRKLLTWLDQSGRMPTKLSSLSILKPREDCWSVFSSNDLKQPVDQIIDYSERKLVVQASSRWTVVILIVASLVALVGVIFGFLGFWALGAWPYPTHMQFATLMLGVFGFCGFLSFYVALVSAYIFFGKYLVWRAMKNSVKAKKFLGFFARFFMTVREVPELGRLRLLTSDDCSIVSMRYEFVLTRLALLEETVIIVYVTPKLPRELVL